MIKEAYCSYETAKLLKEKGFDEPCRSYFIDYIDYIDYSYSTEEVTDLYMGVDEILRPTHQMACAWLREKHHIYANPIRQGNYDDCSDYYTWIVASNGTIHRNQSVADKLSYEDAVEAALKYSLENLMEEQQ